MSDKRFPWRSASWMLFSLIVFAIPVVQDVACGQQSDQKEVPSSGQVPSAESEPPGDTADVRSPSDSQDEELLDQTREGTGADAPSEADGGPRMSFTRQEMLLASLTVFVLAIFVGFEVITKVPPTLHTPLMSGSNAISGITIVGALIVAGYGLGFAPFLGFIAVILASINVVGGFWSPIVCSRCSRNADSTGKGFAVDTQSIVKLVYIIAAVLFIFGLKNMTHPRTAVRGNLLGAAGMILAILVALVTVVTQSEASYVYIVLGIIVGTLIGGVLAYRIQMTAMPQLVALFNGFGGLASVFVAGGAMVLEPKMTTDALLATGVSGLIGGVTFSGSVVAFGKLQELDFFKRPLSIPYRQPMNAGVAVVALLLAALVTAGYGWVYVPLALVALGLGFLLVNPIGGADMPVVIALLNSYSGLAAAATGFVIDNYVLIIAGSLVGASGIILTSIMCKAMNRSLFHVLFGVMDAGSSAEDVDELYATVRSTSPDDVAMILDGAQRVVFVPGYGMAVAQAQHAVRNLAKLLEERGVTVQYAIHPVAGRMPGHMNVLLAEADVPYDQLKEMDEINPTFDTVDVAIVIGANDVVNPVARTDPKSPIAGMPIIDVDKARTVIIIKRSLSPGFAGIPNPLFAAENTLMLFGDGQQAIVDIISAVKEN